MAIKSLPPQSEIDRTRVGLLRITLEAIGGLLRLPLHLKVTGAEINRVIRCIEVVIEGADMPPRPDRWPPEPVDLLVTQAADGSTTAAWEHAPDKSWPLHAPNRPREIGYVDTLTDQQERDLQAAWAQAHPVLTDLEPGQC
jgi:hypothetical protein